MRGQCSRPRSRPAVAWNADGLVPAIAQQYDTGEVLMLAWMNAEALRATLTRPGDLLVPQPCELWVKGETSGHHQHVRSVAMDCDGDTLLVQVDQVGAACHTGDPPASSPPLDHRHRGRAAVTTGVVAPDEKTFRELARDPPGHPGDPAAAGRR